LIQSSMARALGRLKLDGASWTTSARVTFGFLVSWMVMVFFFLVMTYYLLGRTSFVFVVC